MEGCLLYCFPKSNMDIERQTEASLYTTHNEAVIGITITITIRSDFIHTLFHSSGDCFFIKSLGTSSLNNFLKIFNIQHVLNIKNIHVNKQLSIFKQSITYFQYFQV